MSDRRAAPEEHAPSRYGLPLLVLAMTAVLALGMLPLAGMGAVATSATIPLWLATLAFGASAWLTVDVPTRRERHSITLSELPLVVSLFFLAPIATIVAQVVGSAVVLVGPMRQRGMKLGFNLALCALQGLVAVVTFRAVLGAGSPESVRALLAAAVAACFSDLLSGVLVMFAIWLHSRAFHRETALWTVITTAISALAKTAIALLAVVVLEKHAANAVVLLAIVAAVMYLAFRLYAGLYLRHQRVEKLYRFTRAVSGSVETDEVSELVVREARDLLRASCVELVLYGTAGRTMRLDDNDQWVRETGASGEGADADAESKAWVARHGSDFALAQPLGGDVPMGWLGVARTDDPEPFPATDAQLFAALANHASVALVNGRLLDELSHAARQREHQALHDPLTGLPNRVQLTDAITAAIEVAASDERVALLTIGLDDFREINETLGHDHGDDVLREVADRLRDVAGGSWTAARLGGDEFAILVPDAHGVGVASRTAELVVREFEERPFRVAGLVIELGVRVGVALHPDHGSTAQQLLRRAEIALRTARGRHTRISAFAPGDDPHTPRQLVLAHELRRALEQEDLAVYVQPQVDLASGAVTAVEALVRWPRDGDVMAPDEFIPVAERTGLIRPLTQYVLNRALEARRQWVNAGYEIDVSVNVSVRDLVDPSFPEQVAVALTRAVCPARALTLEITETQIMAEHDRVAAALRRFAILGVQVSIDDFGTGYSSLSSVRALAVDEVKIDRSFVQNAAHDEQDCSLVQSITQLGHGLGLRVVAEGAEDDETLALLRDLGVDCAQGYGISRPMPAVDLPGWLAALDELAEAEVR